MIHHQAISQDTYEGSSPRGITAWVIQYAPGRLAALPPRTTLELVENPVPAGVPGAAGYCHGILAWQSTYLPLISLSAVLSKRSFTKELELPQYALIVAYQEYLHSPIRYGALGLSYLPELETITEQERCDFPQDSDAWQKIALSCFLLRGERVPVIDTSSLFGCAHAYTFSDSQPAGASPPEQ